jgi:hypothetical protein
MCNEWVFGGADRNEVPGSQIVDGTAYFDLARCGGASDGAVVSGERCNCRCDISF